jgi:hypothetical protein
MIDSGRGAEATDQGNPGRDTVATSKTIEGGEPILRAGARGTVRDIAKGADGVRKPSSSGRSNIGIRRLMRDENTASETLLGKGEIADAN